MPLDASWKEAAQGEGRRLLLPHCLLSALGCLDILSSYIEHYQHKWGTSKRIYGEEEEATWRL